MVRLHDEHPAYCWADNKGYSAPEHLQALLQLGPCEHHRRSWRLPCTTDPLVSENEDVAVPEQVGGLSREQQISIMEVMTR
jgi:ribonuclease HII